jgi:hypothetical protein
VLRTQTVLPIFTDSVEELSPAAVLEKDELALALHPAAIALDNVGMLQQFVDANLFTDRLLSLML